MNLPKISIITPSYNQGAFIEETILSVITQEKANIEYIIMDGGSTDNTVEIIKKYEEHITYWVSEKDRGQSDAINKGFRMATGDIMCWLNSDDIFMPGALQRVTSFFMNNPDADFFNGNTLIIDEHSNILTGLFILLQKKWYAKRGIYYVNQPAMFWRARVFDRVGLLKEDYHASMDREFMIRIFRADLKIGYTHKILSGFRVHKASKSAAGWSNQDFHRDLKELRQLYGVGYGSKPKLRHKLLYGGEKLLKGLYFQKWLFTARWKGKHLTALTPRNCRYL